MRKGFTVVAWIALFRLLVLVPFAVLFAVLKHTGTIDCAWAWLWVVPIDVAMTTAVAGFLVFIVSWGRRDEVPTPIPSADEERP